MRLALFVVGIVACALHCVGPARASTTEDALDLLCGPGHRDMAPHVNQAARRYLHHPVTLVAQMAKESGCDMAARGARGERCAMQVLPYGPARNGHSAAELMDPATCIDTGARWLALREANCGGLLLGLSGYNARTCGGGKRYARRVLALVAKFWNEKRRQLGVRS